MNAVANPFPPWPYFDEEQINAVNFIREHVDLTAAGRTPRAVGCSHQCRALVDADDHELGRCQ